VHVIEPRDAHEFLAQRRLAVVGASDRSGNFGATIYRALRDHGYDAVAVNPRAHTVAGDLCYPDLAEVPGDIDGAVVMVHRDHAADVVRDCARRGIPRVWLFQGAGGASAVSDAAVEACHQYGLAVVAGACPLMFLEPVGWIHRVHRSVRRARGGLARAVPTPAA
jgi:acyl-CoA synthetase (NDP forming)